MQEIVSEESSLCKLWKLHIFLGWSEAAVGAALSSFSGFGPLVTEAIISRRAYERLLNPFRTEVVAGMATALVAVQGILAADFYQNHPFSKTTRILYRTWTALGFFLIFFLTVALFVVPSAVDIVENEILGALEGGISSYLDNREWKEIFDRLHQELRCCGVHSITDWMTSRWIPIRSLRTEVADLKNIIREDGTLGDKVVPASCCNPQVKSPCFHDVLQSPDPGDPSAGVRSNTLFTRGCAKLIIDPLSSTVPLLKSLASTIVIFQIGQLIISRYYLAECRRTSRRNEAPYAPSKTPPQSVRSRRHFGQTVNHNSSLESVKSGSRRRKFLSGDERNPLKHVKVSRGTSLSCAFLTNKLKKKIPRFWGKAPKTEEKFAPEIDLLKLGF